MTISKLYEKDRYLNKELTNLVDCDIIEYDIRQAGYNITKYYKLLPENQIEELSKLSKENKRIRLGLIQRNNKEYKEKLKEAFKNIRKEFFEANEITDNDVLAIKKDAIFLVKPCLTTKFGNVRFIPKNRYSSYYNLNGLELYFSNKRQILDAKGINDEVLKRHEGFMLEFLKDIFTLNENDPTMEKSTKLLMEFSKEYKSMQLPIEFYREFNENSLFKTHLTMNNESKILYISDISEDNEEFIGEIDIRFNFINVIMPLVRITF